MPDTMTMSMATLDDLLLVELQELFSGEQMGLQAMQTKVEQADSPALKQMLQEHIETTQAQVQRLDRIASLMNAPLDGTPALAVQALIDEGQQKIQATTDPAVRDALIIAGQQKMEHLEIACYGTARSHALQLNQAEVADLLQQTLQEEKQTDERLTVLAENSVNDQADPQHSQGS